MVHLNPMTESEFQAYRKGAVEELARQRVREGDWQPADALHKAEQEFLRMLPQGCTPKTSIFYLSRLTKRT